MHDTSVSAAGWVSGLEESIGYALRPVKGRSGGKMRR